MNLKIDSGSNELQTPKSLSKTLLRGSVLCIFEDVETGKKIESAMASQNFAVLRARHGMHAYWLAINSKPDLIITDAIGSDSSFLLNCLARNSRTSSLPVIGMVNPVQCEVARESLKGFAAAVSTDTSPVELRQVADELIESSLKPAEIRKGPSRKPIPVNEGVAESVDAIFSEIGHEAARRPNIAPYLGGGSVTSETIGTNL